MEINCGKVKFRTEKDAFFYIDKLSKISERKLVPRNTYLCEKCFMWHLTSKGTVELENKLIKDLEYKIKQKNELITKLEEIIRRMKAHKTAIGKNIC